MEPLLIILVILAVVAMNAVVLRWRFGKSRSLLDDWASRQGYTILSAERRFLRRGPFWWRTTQVQDVFFVTLRDATGTERRCYVRAGGLFLGMLSDQVSVEWK